MQGLIVINAFSGIGKHQAARLAEEFAARGVSTDIVPDVNVCSAGYDFCVFLDKDIYTARRLECEGLPLFDSSRTIALCDDKMLTYLALEQSGVPYPETISGAFSYTDGAPVTGAECDYVTATLGLPLVFKLNKSSLGEGVFLVNDADELRSLITKYRTTPHLYQRYVSSSKGRDIRVIVIGGKAVACMERVNEHDFRSNIAEGGVARAYRLTDDIRNIAIRASEAVSSDYCGVDILLNADGSPTICEINSNAFFRGIESVAGVNVAGAYAEHILSVLRDKRL